MKRTIVLVVVALAMLPMAATAAVKFDTDKRAAPTTTECPWVHQDSWIAKAKRWFTNPWLIS